MRPDKWVLAKLKDRLLVPEVIAESMRVHAEYINLLRREGRASGASAGQERVKVERRTAAIVAVIKDGASMCTMVDPSRELAVRLSFVPANPSDPRPTIMDAYRCNITRLALGMA